MTGQYPRALLPCVIILSPFFPARMGISYVQEAEEMASGIFISPEYDAPFAGYRGFDFHMTPLESPATVNKPTRLHTTYDRRFDVLL